MSASISRTEFHHMPLHEKTRAYFAGNLISLQDNGKRPPGPSLMSQAAFWNDWHKAFQDFEETLPLPKRGTHNNTRGN